MQHLISVEDPLCQYAEMLFDAIVGKGNWDCISAGCGTAEYEFADKATRDRVFTDIEPKLPPGSVAALDFE